MSGLARYYGEIGSAVRNKVGYRAVVVLREVKLVEIEVICLIIGFDLISYVGEVQRLLNPDSVIHYVSD